MKNFWDWFYEEFDIVFEDEYIYLSHPKWSLTGMGKTLIDAERDLLKEAKESLIHYQKYAGSELTEDALEMKEYLIKIV